MHLAEQVGPVCGVDAGRVGPAERVVGLVENRRDLGPAVLREAVVAALLLERPVGHEVHREERSVLLDDGQRLVVDEVRVLDAANAGLDGAGDRPTGVGVRGHVPVGRLGLLDHRLDLGDRVLRRVDPVGG